MRIIADLEVHSKYARAVSPQMTIPVIAEWAAKKGIDLVGTGDFTHPMWLRELEANLKDRGGGVYEYGQTKFLLTSEVSCIYAHNGKTRRVHLLVFLPSLTAVKKFNSALTQRGANLFSDGRPIIGLSLAQVAELALDADERAILIPAHVWTPWFGIYGANGGYDSLLEAFGDLAPSVPAVETGLSSDPAMNWRIAELSSRQIVSFSDAHSPAKLGREATAFNVGQITYDEIAKFNVAHTLEFYPEEGKYHYTGHRKCQVVHTPRQTRKLGTTCPVCGKNLTVGVLARVEHLASSDAEIMSSSDQYGVKWFKDPKGIRPGYAMLVPLLEILAEAEGVGVGSKKVDASYELLLNHFQTEFKVLLETPVKDIARVAGERIAEGIAKVRSGDIVIEPGYDGVFGKVKIWKETEKEASPQPSLF